MNKKQFSQFIQWQAETEAGVRLGALTVFLASQDAIEVMSVTDYLTDRFH